MRVLVVGAGWAGLSAAIEATRLGHHATVVEASRTLGGRARAVQVALPGSASSPLTTLETTLDNGQHILIGAYSETLQLLHAVGVDTQQALLRLPLTLRYPDGSGLTLPDWSLPRWSRAWLAGLDVAVGVLRAKGWSGGDKLSLLRAAHAWRRSGFSCPDDTSVAQLCQGISQRVMTDMLDPLVASALNTPSERASAKVFLRVLHDSLFANGAAPQSFAGSNMLLPRTDLGTLFPKAAAQWLRQQGAQVLLGQRVSDLRMLRNKELSTLYSIDQKPIFTGNYDATILATPAWEAARLVRSAAGTPAALAWADCADALQHEAITTAYAHSPAARLAQPVMALHSSEDQPAQFVFDRGALHGGAQQGLLALVVSASTGDAASLEQRVLAQGREQLGLPDLQAVKTIVEKRATFACTPGLVRPAMQIEAGVWACGDYVEGPYPATLEGAVRSGLAAARSLSGV